MVLSISTTRKSTAVHIDKNAKTRMDRGVVILTTLVTSILFLHVIYGHFWENDAFFKLKYPYTALPILKINMTNMTNMTRPIMTGLSAVHIEPSRYGQGWTGEETEPQQEDVLYGN